MNGNWKLKGRLVKRMALEGKEDEGEDRVGVGDCSSAKVLGESPSNSSFDPTL